MCRAVLRLFPTAGRTAVGAPFFVHAAWFAELELPTQDAQAMTLIP